MSRLAVGPGMKGKGDGNWGPGLRPGEIIIRPCPSGGRQASRASKMNPARRGLSVGGFWRGFDAIFTCFGSSKMVRVGVYRHAIMKSHHMRVILVGLFSGEFSVCASVRP